MQIPKLMDRYLDLAGPTFMIEFDDLTADQFEIFDTIVSKSEQALRRNEEFDLEVAIADIDESLANAIRSEIENLNKNILWMFLLYQSGW